MSEQTPISQTAVKTLLQTGPSEAHHLYRLRLLLWAPLMLAIVAALLWIAWIALDPQWAPRPRGKGAWVILLLVLTPVWIRVPLLLGFAGELIRLTIWRVIHAFDDKPDFTIGPEGVGGLDYNVFRLIPWKDVHSIVRHKFGISILGPERHGNLMRLIAGRRHTIMYSRYAFKKSEVDILLSIRSYRPDLTNNPFRG